VELPGALEAPERRSATLSQSATKALGLARSLILQSFHTSFETQLEDEARSIAAAGRDAESIEGIAAFMAKRPPQFPELK
jgi:2-(1,2-epoxy-1,2-dihydrophenyl)acetyl-CoA isomerase